MMTLLIPEQISRRWSTIRQSMEQALPAGTRNTVDLSGNVLSMLLGGRMQCWIFHEGSTVIAIMTTMINKDECDGTNVLFIYSFYGFTNIEGKHWIEGTRTLMRWAAKNRVSRLTAYSSALPIIKIAQKLGGDTSQTLIVIPVTDALEEDE